jgi:membrane peptidoglycan carboxypeptidase
MYEFQKDESGFVKYRHFQWLGWYVLVELFLDENEVYAIFCSMVYNGSGHGLNELSLRLFGRPLSELTLIEAAEVVVYIRGPSYYARRGERLDEAIDVLLKRFRENAYNNSLHSAH